MTRVPWSHGRALVWDVTVVDTLAKSHVGLTSATPGSAAEKAEELKKIKYQAISDRFTFVPVGFETVGSWGPEAYMQLKEIGRKLVEQTGIKSDMFFDPKNQHRASTS